jgi:transposase InsO family protein
MLSIELKMSNVNHPKTNAQIERTNHTLEDMLRNFVGRIQVTWE